VSDCGPRPVDEFTHRGEVTKRPAAAPSLRELTAYLYFRRNVAGAQREWWYHALGCELWFQAERDTRTNEVLTVEVAGEGAVPSPETPARPDTPAV
jgi:heterotetrameric sarcosine oxidase delta subunit